MADDVNKQINIEYTTSGADAARKALQGINTETEEGRKAYEYFSKSVATSEAAVSKYEKKINSLIATETRHLQAQKKSNQAIRDRAKAISDAESAAQGSRLYRNASTTIDSAISQGQSIRSTELSQLKAAILEREALAKSTQSVSTATQDLSGNLPRLRYALYDVSSTLTFAGVAMAGLATATVATSITMDRQFADVVRTTGTYLDSTGQAAANLRGEFDDLFSSVPTSWADLTQIGTLAGQLGVATENVSEFSSLVAKFSAVTDVTVDASATAFGRLSELLNVSAAEYENLGSSIAAAGVSSVATESQIIAISSQIASMGAFVGMSADEVIGLSSALASLGVQPELSRGTLTRLFTNVTNAIAEGGEKLDRFGSIAKMSGADFATAWGNNASDALYQLLDGLGQVEDSQAVAVLNSVGITAARDVPTILKLAQNTELLGEQLQIASSGYVEGTALQEQYGVIAETVASKIEVLRNNFALFVDALGSAGSALGPVIDFLTDVLQGMTAFVNHPIGQALAVIAVGLTAVGGVLALLAGASARGAAGLLAMATAAQDLTGSSIGSVTSLKALETQLRSVGVAGNTAATSIRGLRAALISTGIGAAFVALGSVIGYFVSKADEANESTQRLSDAISADTKAGEGVKLATDYTVNYGRATEGVAITQEAWNKILDGSSTYSEEYAKAVDTATEAVENFQAVAGEGTRAEILDIFQESDAIKEAFEGGLLPEDLDFSELTDILIREGQEGADAYLSELFNVEKLKSRRAELLKAIQDDPLITEGMAFQEPETWSVNQLTDDQMDLLAAFKASSESLTDYNSVLDAVNSTQERMTVAVEDAAYAQRILAGESDEAAKSTYDAGDAAYDAAFGYDEAAGSVREYVDSIFGAINANAGLSDSLYNLGQSVYENGQNFDVFSATGRENMQALQDVFAATADWAAQNGVTFEDAMAQVGGAMVQAGVISVKQLEALGVSAVGLGNNLLSVAEATSQAVAALRNQMSALQDANNGLTRGQSADGLRYAGQALAVIEKGGAGAETAMKSMGLQFDRLETSGLGVDNLLNSIMDGWNDAGDAARKSGGSQKKAADDTAKAAKDAQKEIRTLSDYVSDLSGVINDAYDFDFGFDEASDDLKDAQQAWDDYFTDARADVDDAKQSIRGYRAEIKGIKADLGLLKAERGTLQYFLGIAIEYGDTKRAAEIQAQLGKNAADTTEKQNDLKDAQGDLEGASKDLAEAQQKLVPDLSGTTEASREQRDIMRELIQANNDAIIAYANTGVSQQELGRFVKELEGDFKDQRRELGYTEGQVDDAIDSFAGLKKIIREVPRNLTVGVSASTSGADKALGEFVAKKRTATVSSKANTSGAKSGLDNFVKGYKGNATLGYQFKDKTSSKEKRGLELAANILSAQNHIRSVMPGTSYYGSLVRNLDTMTTNYRSGNYAEGGFTGRGGKYEPAGTVHRGEYVVPKEGVNQATGLPYADYFNRLSRGVPSPAGYANGGHVQGAGYPSMVSLSPGTIQQLAAAIPQVLMMNGQVVGQVTSEQYAMSTRRGSN